MLTIIHPDTDECYIRTTLGGCLDTLHAHVVNNWNTKVGPHSMPRDVRKAIVEYFKHPDVQECYLLAGCELDSNESAKSFEVVCTSSLN